MPVEIILVLFPLIIIIIIIVVMLSLDKQDYNDDQKDGNHNNKCVEKQTHLALEVLHLRTALFGGWFCLLCIFRSGFFCIAHIGAVLHIIAVPSVHAVLIDRIDQTGALIAIPDVSIHSTFSFYINSLRYITCRSRFCQFLRCCDNVSILGLKT